MDFPTVNVDTCSAPAVPLARGRNSTCVERSPAIFEPFPAAPTTLRKLALRTTTRFRPTPCDGEAADRMDQMFEREMCRSFSVGILDTASTTFLILLAVRVYDAPPLARGILAATSSIGYLLSPFVLAAAKRSGWRTSTCVSLLYLAASLAFLPAAVANHWEIFVLGSVVAMALGNSVIALLTTLYQHNYPSTVRGRLLSRTMMIRIGTVVGFSICGGWIVGIPVYGPHLLIGLFSLAAALAALSQWGCPSDSLARSPGMFARETLVLVWNDRLFRNTMTCWMFMGFGNLMMIALRVEYLANPAHGIELTAAQVALFTGVIPNLARFAFSNVWGRIFDRMNFFALRIVLNLCFATSILAFFSSTSAVGLTIGALIFGGANAGSDLAWNLWVTKFAPPDRVAGYMALHVFLTGVRGVLAPIVAFSLLGAWSVTSVAWLAVLLIVSANLWLIPELRRRS